MQAAEPERRRRIRKGNPGTNPLLKKVAGYIERNRLFHDGDTVIIAVSGGADSVALLDILVSLRCPRLTCIVAHLNHGLRGAESDEDAAFVADLAQRYGLPAEVASVDVREFGRTRRLSLEEAGRVARYEWFDALARSRGARLVALGHHADDQAETFLLRLLRGAGTTGLCGMRPLSAGRYVRPLLSLTRAEIIAYLKDRGIAYRTDSSNDDTDFLRNRIRHECLPYLATYNPAVSARLNCTAEILAADEEVLEQLTGELFERCSRGSVPAISLELGELRGALPGMRLRVYRRAVLALKGSLARITGSHLTQIDALAFSAKPGAGLSLPAGVTVRRSYDTLLFLLSDADRGGVSWEIRITAPGTYILPDGGTLTVRFAPPPLRHELSAVSRAWFDPLAAPFPWTVRTFRPGDRFRPFGLKGTKKLKDFFIERKVPVSERSRVPLLFSGAELLWVCGLRVAEAGRMVAGIPEVVEVEIPEITP